MSCRIEDLEKQIAWLKKIEDTHTFIIRRLNARIAAYRDCIAERYGQDMIDQIDDSVELMSIG